MKGQKVIVAELAPYSQDPVVAGAPPTALYWKNLSFDHGVMLCALHVVLHNGEYKTLRVPITSGAYLSVITKI